jgi:hypothetical protein
MNSNHLENEQVQLADIVKRSVAVADANILFITFYFAVDYLTRWGLTRIAAQLAGVGGEAAVDQGRLTVFLSIYCVVASVVQAFLDCIIARLLRKQVLGIQPDAGLLLGATLRKFYFRMLLLNAIYALVSAFALELAVLLHLPLPYPAIYIPLRYAAAFVIWRDCGVRAAFAGLARFLSAHFRKFLPVWLAGTVIWFGAELTSLAPASKNLLFQGLVTLVVAYFDFAVVATALVSFTMLERKQQEVHA